MDICRRVKDILRSGVLDVQQHAGYVINDFYKRFVAVGLDGLPEFRYRRKDGQAIGVLCVLGKAVSGCQNEYQGWE